MRCGVGAIVALGFGLGLAQSASGADYWPLRGSSYDPPVRRGWEGVYFGGQGGYSSVGMNFGNANGGQISYLLRSSELESDVSDWTTLPSRDTKAWGVGGFLGYNFQYGDVVLGFEASYNRTYDTKLAETDSLSRMVYKPSETPPTDGDQRIYDVTVTSGASAEITDMATFRGRVGWATGAWLPYAFGGVAVARANITQSSTIAMDMTTRTYVGGVLNGTVGPTTLPTLSTADAREGVFVYGYTLGLGVDVELTQNLFARGEWEWVDLRSNDIKMHTSSVRGGLGLKF